MDEERIEEENPVKWNSTATVIVAMTILVVLVFSCVYRKLLFVLWKTFPRDAKALWRLSGFVKDILRKKFKSISVARAFDEVANQYPNDVGIFFQDEEWTLKQLQSYTNRVAQYFQTQGFEKGDVVALFMENRPQYIALWLGLTKLGVVPALINYNLRKSSLQHSIEVVKCKGIIFGAELASAIQELNESLNFNQEGLKFYCSGLKKDEKSDVEFHWADVKNLDEKLKDCSDSPPTGTPRIGFNDKLFYIYTSGTTGLPKAAIITQSRFMMASMGAHYMMKISKEDRVYIALPLYHTAGGVLGLGQLLLFGSAIVLRKKFSASNFWKDCVKYKVTVGQYIGEICRYLLSQTPSKEESEHNIRVMCGNGLRKEIWNEFKERFSIPQISEFYGSTEGNTNLVNIDGHVGAVGFLPRLLLPIFPAMLVQVDKNTGEILRNEKGRVIRCKFNEPGELIGQIVVNNPVREFHGYADKAATEKKIIRNAFKEGDAYFRSGDVLSVDEFGYFFFKDRIGDTYRWKGENVSTAEVESVFSSCCSLTDAVVFGVLVPGTEGRAGMAVIADPAEKVDVNVVNEKITPYLPKYAVPLFIRIIKEIDLTGTYKMKKTKLQEEAFDVTKITDHVYFRKNDRYEPLDIETYHQIMDCKVKL